jgi:hypothetical protein
MAGSGKGSWFSGTLVIAIGIIVLIFALNICEKKPSSSSSTNTAGEEESTDPSKYTLAFSDTFNRGLASQDDLGLSIMIAVDCSGSMADKLSSSSDSTPKYKLASESLTEVIGFLEDFYVTKIKGQGVKLRMGLLRFNENVQVLFNLTDMNEGYFNEIKAIASKPDEFRPSGKTAIGETIHQGVELLSQAGTIFKSLIIITDGENTEGVEPEPVLSAVVENRNNKNTKDFPVITSSVLVSFIGFDMEASAFGGLQTIGSRVMSASNKIALNDSLKNLFLADITKLEAK